MTPPPTAMLLATIVIYLAALTGIALLYAYFTEVYTEYVIHTHVHTHTS